MSSSSWYTWVFTGGPYSVLSLLLVWAVMSTDDDVGKSDVVAQTAMCSRWGAAGQIRLTQDGEIVTGGLFNLCDMHPPAIESLTKLPLYNPCTGVILKLASLSMHTYAAAMVFTVEEINCDAMLLLGVRLRCHIVDGFGGSWGAALHGVLSLVGGDRDKSNSTAPVPHFALSERLESTRGGNSAPLVIADVSSSTSVMLCLTLSPLSVPVVATSVCSESCPPGSGVARRKHVCCFDRIPYVSNVTGSLYCERGPFEFWSDAERPPCILRPGDFPSFKETSGVSLTAVAGAVVTAAVFVLFLYVRHTPLVRANDSEMSFLFVPPRKLCFVRPLAFIGHPSAWSCRFQQAVFGTSFVLYCVSRLLVKTIVVLVAFRSTRPGAGDVMKWFGPDQRRGSVFLFTSIQVIIYIPCASIRPTVHGLGVKGSTVNLECAIKSVVGLALVLGCIGLLFRWPSYVYGWPSTFSMLIFCAAVWMAIIVAAYDSCLGRYSVAVEMFAILASNYALLICIFTPKCFIHLLRPERKSKKHILASLESL